MTQNHRRSARDVSDVSQSTNCVKRGNFKTRQATPDAKRTLECVATNAASTIKFKRNV